MMPLFVRTALLATLLLAAATAPSPARAEAADELEIVGRLVEWTGPRFHCGRAHVIGDMTYEVVRVIRGSATVGGQVYVAHSCPAEESLSVGHHYRLRLSRRRPAGQPVRPAPDGSPRRWVLRAELVTAPGQLLDRARAAIEGDHRPTGTDQGWVLYGEGLAIRYVSDRATRVRARLPAGLSCNLAARWMGFTPGDGSFGLRRRGGCDWPGISLRHRLAPHRAASHRGGVFEVWITD